MTRIDSGQTIVTPAGGLETGGFSTPADTVFVHLCGGDVVPVSPATSVTVNAGFVIVYYGDTPVASYDRREVYTCSKTQTSPVIS